jgi:magnesium-transporting ATPase (P-type)
VVLSCSNLSVDESLLTGESVPVRKFYWDGVLGMGHPGGDDLVYPATLVVKGQGLAWVLATGLKTEAASLVLLDDDFSSIVQAIRLGRRIFDNLKKAMAYIFAILAGGGSVPEHLPYHLTKLRRCGSNPSLTQEPNFYPLSKEDIANQSQHKQGPIKGG